MRTCTECNLSKSPEHFHKKSSSKDGLRSKCKVCIVDRSKSYYSRNKDKVRASNIKWNKANPIAYKAMKKRAQLVQIASGNNAAKVARRRAIQLEATPAWLTEEQKADITAMYKLAKKFEKLCNVRYHVDHIVPLAGKDVRGLHVPWNLQILPASINIAKGNRTNEEALSG